MTVRVCVVESQMTGREYSFLYDGDEALEARMREVIVKDTPHWVLEAGYPLVLPTESENALEWACGNFNWMSGPAPDAEE